MPRPHRPGIPPKRYGTPTVPPEPQALDPASGFKVPLSNLRRQWDNQMVDYRFIDRRNPQDYVRGVKDDQSLPFARPEPPDTYVAGNIIWQDGAFMTTQQGAPLITQGVDPQDTF